MHIFLIALLAVIGSFLAGCTAPQRLAGKVTGPARTVTGTHDSVRLSAFQTSNGTEQKKVPVSVSEHANETEKGVPMQPLEHASISVGDTPRKHLEATPTRENLPVDSLAAQPAPPQKVPLPPAPATDSDAQPNGGEMTMAQWERLALDHNPTLLLQRAEVEKERGHWQQAGLYPNPTVGYLNSSSSNGQSQENGMLVQQTFITAGKLDKAQASEAYGIQTTQWQLEAQQMRVINDVRLRYIDVLAAQQQIEVVKELLKLSEQALQAARTLYEAKQVARTDVLQAEVQNRTVHVALESAKACARWCLEAAGGDCRLSRHAHRAAGRSQRRSAGIRSGSGVGSVCWRRARNCEPARPKWESPAHNWPSPRRHPSRM